MATAERITRQYDIDCWQIALARYDKLELGYQRIMELTELAQQVRQEYARAITRDNEQDYYRVHMDRELQEIAKTVLHMPFEGTDAELDELEGMSFEEYPDRRLTVSEISVLKVAKKAMRGDIAALQFLRDTAGEKPVEKVEVAADVSGACEEIGRLIEAKRNADKG